MDFAQPQEIIATNAGGTETIVVDSTVNFVIVTGTAGALGADLDIVTDIVPPDGTTLWIEYNANITKGAFNVTMPGVSLTTLQATKKLLFCAKYFGGVAVPTLLIDMSQSGVLETAMYVAKSVTLAKMADATRGMLLRYGAAGVIETFDAKTDANILIGDGVDIISVVQSGHVLFAKTGQSTIQAGVILNTMCNAAMALARTKLASGTASHVVINDGGGVMSSEAQLSALRGGNGIDNSAATGFPRWAAGTQAVTSLIFERDLDVSFAAASVGDFKIKMHFTGTLTEIYSYATTVIAGTDAGTIIAKNNGGTTMTSGTITYAAADARGTAYTVSPNANNTFVDGDFLTFTTAKATAGGEIHLTLKFTRTT